MKPSAQYIPKATTPSFVQPLGHSEDRWANVALLGFILFSSLSALGSMFYFDRNGYSTLAAMEMIYSILGFCLLPLALPGRNHRLGAHLAAALFIAHIGVFFALTGGTSVEALVHFTVFPTLFTFLLGPQQGVFWSLAGLFAVCLPIAAFRLRPDLPVSSTLRPSSDLSLFSAVFAYAFQLGFNALFQSARQRRLQELEKITAELTEQAETTRVLQEQRSAAEARQEELRKQMIHASRLASVGELASGVAHEINNPLQVLRSQLTWFYDELERKSALNEEFRAILDRQAMAVNRIRSIVNGLTNYARPAGQAAEIFDAHQAIEETVSLVENMFRKRGIQLELRLDATIPLILGNPANFSQVLMNLLSNARDSFAGASGGSILVHTKNDGERFVLAVSDTGCGIPKEILPRIFETYFTTKESDRGTGLGLSLTKSFVRQLGGRIDVRSEPGQGSTFTVELPIAGVSSQGPTLSAETSRRDYRFRKARIMILDDERDVGDILRYILTELELEVDVYDKASAALNALETASYDVIITDYQMPGLTGDQFIRKARPLTGATTHFLLITGNPRVIEQARAAGEFGILPKPFSEESLLSTLETWLSVKADES